MATMNLSDEQMNKVIAGAILQQLTPESREKILSDAVASLMVPDTRGYGSPKTSPLQDAFRNAAQNVAMKVARENLENDPAFREKVDGLLKEVVERVFGADRERVIEKMVDSMFRRLD